MPRASFTIILCLGAFSFPLLAYRLSLLLRNKLLLSFLPLEGLAPLAITSSLPVTRRHARSPAPPHASPSRSVSSQRQHVRFHLGRP
jgi:hypothetical protein